MKTLTITDAKKSLGRWLKAASLGEDIGIVSGADIIALRKVEVDSTDYAQSEYGVTPGQLRTFAKATDARYRKMQKAGKLITVHPSELKKLLE